MPKEFWAEAISCVVYLNNRSPARNVRDQTPLEVWSGRKPSVNHVRIFGSIAYAHVPHQGRAKLDDQSVKYVFVGYDASSTRYHLYNPNNNKVVVSCDVEFDEATTWNKQQHGIERLKKKEHMIFFHTLEMKKNKRS